MCAIGNRTVGDVVRGELVHQTGGEFKESTHFHIGSA